MDDAAGAQVIVTVWNEAVPRGRVRHWTRYRVQRVREVLQEYSVEQVCMAIRFYAAQPWQRQRGAWKAFDDWMTIEIVTHWLEAAEEHAERQDAARDRAASAEAARQADAASRREIEAAFDALPEDTRRSLCRRIQANLPPYLSNSPARLRQLALNLWLSERSQPSSIPPPAG